MASAGFLGEPTYHDFAESYYERSVNLETARQICRHAPLKDDLATQLNPGVSWELLNQDAREIGYPIG